MNYQAFIKSAKDFANRGEEHRLKLMLLLVEYEPLKALWMANPHGIRKWDALLRHEGLCTPSLFHAFRRASKIVDVKLFGVYGSAAIEKLPKEHRAEVILRTRAWINEHKLPPHYQRVTQYVRLLKSDLGIRVKAAPATSLKREVGKLKARLEERDEYIVRLKDALRRHKIRPPQE